MSLTVRVSLTGLKVLFLSTRAARPSYRYRVEQMLPCFERAGHDCQVAFFPRSLVSRLLLYRKLRSFDVVFIQKRLLSPLEIAMIRLRSKRLIFDFDDTLIYNEAGCLQPRQLGRFVAMVRSTDLIVCGNEYLAQQAARFGGQTVVVPTAIDTDRFRVRRILPSPSSSTIIGWTGSRSSKKYLNMLCPILAKLTGRIELKIIAESADGFCFDALETLPYRFVQWSAENEVVETAEFDIGLMPLPNDHITQGKCGCKALQYLALGVPAVCSPVGVNRNILRHEHDGFLPETPQDWESILQMLIDNPALRERIGRAGRATAESRFSLNVIAEQLIRAVESTF